MNKKKVKQFHSKSICTIYDRQLDVIRHSFGVHRFYD